MFYKLRQLFRKSGFDIVRFNAAWNPTGRLPAQLSDHGITLVLDVGANAGQFASDLLKKGYTGRIVSFEPLPAAHAELLKKSSKYSNWEIAPRMALGAQPGTLVLNVAGNGVSSSLLPMLDSHAAAAPESRYVGQVPTEVQTLDAVFDTYVKPTDRVFLKIDTQGFEYQVLLGAQQSLARIQGLELELSLLPLYEGQKLHCELSEWVAAQGFELWGMLPAFIEPKSGRMMQMDGIFFRKP